MLSAWILYGECHISSFQPAGQPMQKLLKKPKTAYRNAKEQMVKAHHWLISTAEGCALRNPRAVSVLLSIVTIITIQAQEKRKSDDSK